MTYILVGYLFLFFEVTVNLTIQGAVLSPNLVGSILVAIGLHKLSRQNTVFVKAKFWAIGMLIWAVLLYVGGMARLGVVPPSVPVDFINGFAALAVIYQIVLGLRSLEQRQRMKVGAEPLMQIWKIQCALWLSHFLVSIYLGTDTGYLILGLTYTMVSANIVFLLCVYKVKKVHALL